MAHPGGAPPELFRYSETAIRNSQMLIDVMEQEANQLDSLQQREKLLNAARINYLLYILLKYRLKLKGLWLRQQAR